MPIARIHIWAWTVLHCVVKSEKRGEHRLEDYNMIYRRLVETAI